MPKPQQLTTYSKREIMQWQHGYNSMKSTMRYIEKLLHEKEFSLINKKNLVHYTVEIDLIKWQINKIKQQLKELYSVLREVKKDFSLEVKSIKLSKIIDTNT